MVYQPIYQWQETKSSILLTINLGNNFNLDKNKLDILITSLYIKLNCFPIFLELDLYDKIQYNIENSKKVVITGNNIRLRLIKEEYKIWQQLLYIKDDVLIRRKESILLYQLYIQQLYQKQINDKKDDEILSRNIEWKVKDDKKKKLNY